MSQDIHSLISNGWRMDLSICWYNNHMVQILPVIMVKGRLTSSGQQLHSLDGHQEVPPSPWGWAEMADHSLPQILSDQFLLGYMLLLLATVTPKLL